MMQRLSRIFLVLITIFVGAIYLPQLFWVGFEPRIIPPMVFYSPVIQKFMTGQFGNGHYYYKDEDGKVYNREEADHLLPLLNFRILAARDEMPDTLLGQPITLNEVRHNNVSMRIVPRDVNPPQIPLYPMFESNPPRLRLALPNEYFRMTDCMEFIDSRTNRLSDSLTQPFTNALNRAGFQFPARGVYGNPTARKPYDAGYFIVDNAWQIFNVKKVNGKPYCQKLQVPPNVKITWISVKEKELREFCGMAISDKDELFFVMLNPPRLLKLPIDSYNRKTSDIIFLGNLFYRLVTIRNNGQSESYLMDRNYKLLKTYHLTWPTKYETWAGVASAYLFPFELVLKTSKSYFIHFNFLHLSWKVLYLNVLLALITFFVLFKRRLDAYRLLDLGIILVLGIYGFIGVMLFEHPDA